MPLFGGEVGYGFTLVAGDAGSVQPIDIREDDVADTALPLGEVVVTFFTDQTDPAEYPFG